MIKQIYKTLLRRYGKQKWWPVTPAGQLSPCYSGGPANAREKLEVIVGAILTQNTSWKNVEKAIFELNSNSLVDIEQLVKIRRDKLARLIKSSGYFNQKAIKLKTVARFLSKYPPQELEQMSISVLRPLLLSVKGIGPETADSIMLYAFNKPVFVIDAYTKRIFSRLGVCHEKIGYDDLQDLFQMKLRKDSRTYNEYHALLVAHGKDVCKKKPLCGACVLKQLCSFGKKE